MELYSFFEYSFVLVFWEVRFCELIIRILVLNGFLIFSWGSCVYSFGFCVVIRVVREFFIFWGRSDWFYLWDFRVV